MTRNTINLTEGSIARGVVLFALPLMLTNLFQQLYNSIDSAVVGSFAGDVSLAAVGSTAALINLLIGFFLGIATGTGVLYAMHYGAEDWPGLKKICDAALVLSLGTAVVISALGIVFTPEMLRLMDMPEDVLPEASVYLRVYLLGVAPNLLYNVAAGMIRAKGDSSRPLIYLAVSGLLNLVLDLLFVAWLGLGAMGAALATILAQLLSCVLALLYMTRLPEEYRFRPMHIVLNRTAVTDVIRISVPCGLQSSMFNISNLLVQTRINAFGSLAMAGVTAYTKLDGFVYMPMNALALTVSTYVGQNVGAGRYDRVRRGIRLCLMLSFGVSLFMAGLVIALFRPVIGLFTDDAAVMDFARTMMWFMCPWLWTFAPSDILGGAMRGAGAATPVMLISAACVCVFRILWLTLALRVVYDIRTVFLVYAISWALSSAAMSVYYFRFSALKRTMRRHAENACAIC